MQGTAGGKANKTRRGSTTRSSWRENKRERRVRAKEVSHRTHLAGQGREEVKAAPVNVHEVVPRGDQYRGNVLHTGKTKHAEITGGGYKRATGREQGRQTGTAPNSRLASLSSTLPPRRAPHSRDWLLPDSAFPKSRRCRAQGQTNKKRITQTVRRAFRRKTGPHPSSPERPRPRGNSPAVASNDEDRLHHPRKKEGVTGREEDGAVGGLGAAAK